MFRKVLVANRGEIAVRVMRTLQEMQIASVAVYSEPDRGALHVRSADEAVAIGPAAAAESYLSVDKIIAACKATGAEALHPGYGFLSENLELAAACEAHGITFIGPPPSAIEAMASKTEARARMEAAGVPVVPGARAQNAAEAQAAAEKLGYPVMIKAAMGGGGKGMRLVHAPDKLASAFDRAQSEAEKSFGDGTVYLEKAIVEPRHVEVQLLGDRDGNIVHLFERDCSIQRRHQKVVEETPCPAGNAELIAEMGRVAVRAAEAVGYFSAGTVEFLLDKSGAFYFLEMNTRLQVEHPITEWITGLDLVREMVRVAAGESLGYGQADVTRSGASIECRVYAEDPSRNFMPSPGQIDKLRVPGGPFVRDDGGVYAGAEVSRYYDPLISKLSVWGRDRQQAIGRMRRALSEYVVTGIRTNLTFHERLLAHPEFVAGRYHTGFIDEHKEALLGAGTEAPQQHRAAAIAAALALRASQQSAVVAPSETGPAGGASPWLAAHRASLLRS